MRLSLKILSAALACAPLTAAADPSPAPSWTDGFLTRVEALALMQTLNASLLASRSATATLEKWCADHKMAPDPKIRARRVAGEEKPASAETRQRLGVDANEPVKYRRVQLMCGEHVLSEADNWYVPGRLSAQMNLALDTTDTPFGKAVAALEPYRRTIEMKIDWSPLPAGWESGAVGSGAGTFSGALATPWRLFEHTAILYGRDQRPFSEVHEGYTREVLDFPAPPAGEQAR